MNFTIFLSTSTLKKKIFYINTHIVINIREYFTHNIVLHKLKIFIRQPHCVCGVRHHHDTADITITSRQ